MPSISSERVQREAPRLGREPSRVRVGADRRRLEPAPARDHDAPRQHFGAVTLRHRVGFAREHRLVEFQAVDRLQDSVGRHLVAGAEVAEVAEHNLGDVDVAHLAGPHDAAPRAR